MMLNKIKRMAVIALFCLVLTPAGLLNAQARMAIKNDCTIELGGRHLLYGFTYQRLLKENLGLEFGTSIIGGSDVTILFLSGGGRYYFSNRKSGPTLAGGLVVLTAGTDSGPFSNSTAGMYLYVTPGFEYRSSGNFLFRAGLNLLINKGMFFWPGVAFGIQF
jgi:hypothetical protein